MITNIIIISVIVLIVLGASLYIVKQKKKGRKCIGCPHSGECSKKNCH
ncbi:MAG: FeoB-associated Cys-rich membrane protein [Ruminococcaceae bacterium]|nr:FeoB-associated Cys-rich membrane protein [Oscillospiraceae bacterium]MBO5039515.1 FeoB-associated Cys-rich membrane protein [Clostridia bacterium]